MNKTPPAYLHQAIAAALVAISATVSQSEQSLQAEQQITTPDSTGAHWYVGIGRERSGPFSTSELKDKIESGLVSEETLVWSPGMAEWARAGAQPSLTEFFKMAGRESASSKPEKLSASDLTNPAPPTSSAASFPLTICDQTLQIEPQTGRDFLRESLKKSLPDVPPSLDLPEQLDYIAQFSSGGHAGGITFNFEGERLTQITLSTFESGDPAACPPIGALLIWLGQEAGQTRMISTDREWSRWEHHGWTFLLHQRTTGEDWDYSLIITRDGRGPQIVSWEKAPEGEGK